MKETRERKKEKYKEKKVNLYIFNEKCTFFRKKFSMTKKKGRQNFFRELKGTFKDFFLKIYFQKIFAPPIFVTKIFAPPIFMTSLRPWWSQGRNSGAHGAEISGVYKYFSGL